MTSCTNYDVTSHFSWLNGKEQLAQNNSYIPAQGYEEMVLLSIYLEVIRPVSWRFYTFINVSFKMKITRTVTILFVHLPASKIKATSHFQTSKNLLVLKITYTTPKISSKIPRKFVSIKTKLFF